MYRIIKTVIKYEKNLPSEKRIVTFYENRENATERFRRIIFVNKSSKDNNLVSVELIRVPDKRLAYHHF